MKLKYGLLVLLSATAFEATANDGAGLIRAVRGDYDLQKFRAKDLADEQFAQQVNFIYAVLSRTGEKHSHQLGGETHNEVWLHNDGHTEVVVRFERDEQGYKIDGTGVLVSDCKNKGSYNYFNPFEQPLGHFAGDIFPWLKLGNCAEDSSTPNERVEAYMLDLAAGLDFVLQKYDEYSLTDSFKFKGKGQSETIALFLKALKIGGFDPSNLGQISSESPELKSSFLAATEAGLKDLMKVPNTRLR